MMSKYILTPALAKMAKEAGYDMSQFEVSSSMPKHVMISGNKGEEMLTLDANERRFVLGVDPAKPSGDETVFGNWRNGNVNSVFTKDMLQRDSSFVNTTVVSMEDIIDAVHLLGPPRERDLVRFVVGWLAIDLLRNMRDNVGALLIEPRNETLMGYHIKEDEYLQRDMLMGLDSFNNILFKIKVGR